MENQIIFEAVMIKREDVPQINSDQIKNSHLSKKYQKSVKSSNSSDDESETLLSVGNSSFDYKAEFQE